MPAGAVLAAPYDWPPLASCLQAYALRRTRYRVCSRVIASSLDGTSQREDGLALKTTGLDGLGARIRLAHEALEMGLIVSRVRDPGEYQHRARLRSPRRPCSGTGGCVLAVVSQSPSVDTSAMDSASVSSLYSAVSAGTNRTAKSRSKASRLRRRFSTVKTQMPEQRRGRGVWDRSGPSGVVLCGPLRGVTRCGNIDKRTETFGCARSCTPPSGARSIPSPRDGVTAQCTQGSSGCPRQGSIAFCRQRRAARAGKSACASH